MITHIAVQIKSVYGSDKIYPACDVAHAYCKALGFKTLTPELIRAVKSLGVKVVQVYNGIEVGEL